MTQTPSPFPSPSPIPKPKDPISFTDFCKAVLGMPLHLRVVDGMVKPAPKINWPPITDEMRLSGFVWAQGANGQFFMICDTCGGNCGQCGQSKTQGQPSMDRLIQKLHNQ